MNILKDYGQSERFAAEAAMYPDLKLARIIAQHKGQYDAVTEYGECCAVLSGKFQYEASGLSSYPAVGDYVTVSFAEDTSKAVIHGILNRKSAFERAAVGVKGQSQVVAANIDIIFLCMSLNQNYNLSRMERYLSIAWDSGAIPVIILTKSDLCDDVQKRLDEVNGIAKFTDIIVTSAFSQSDCEKISAYIKPGMTASFIGSSGVGKSTLINLLMGNEALATAEIGKNDKGRHTTTGREMMILPNGGIVIDTPGMREIGVVSADLSNVFSDIEMLEKNCRFSNCTHTSEPGCAVLQAISDGVIDERRLVNYLKLKRESGYEGLNSKEIEVAKANDMFKEIGGMKNIRKFNRQNNKKR